MLMASWSIVQRNSRTYEISKFPSCAFFVVDFIYVVAQCFRTWNEKEILMHVAIKMSFTHAFLQYPSVLLLFFFPLLRQKRCVRAFRAAGLCKHDDACRGNSKRYHHLIGMKQHKLAHQNTSWNHFFLEMFQIQLLWSSLLNLKVDRSRWLRNWGINISPLSFHIHSCIHGRLV